MIKKTETEITITHENDTSTEKVKDKKEKKKPPRIDRKRELALNNTTELFSKLYKAWAMPPKMLISDWADTYRRLSPESSAEAGRWRTSRAEYQREMMNAINDAKVKKVVFHCSSQIGKALDINTPIPTPSGWTTMEHLKRVTLYLTRMASRVE